MSTYNSIKKNKVKVAVVAILLILVVVLMFLWEMYGRDAIAYRSVAVLVNSVEAGEEITAENIKIVRVADNSAIVNAITDIEYVIGKTTTIYIPKETILLTSYFDSEFKDDNRHKDDLIFAVPNSWIYSMPQTIRRGDDISFYPVYLTGDSRFGTGNISVDSLTDPILQTSVAFAKDSGGTEIIDTSQSSRMSASGVIASIEIYVTQQQYMALLEAVVNGATFNIVY